MLSGGKASHKKAGLRARAVGFLADRRGVAAIEFAFIAPVLLAMYFLSMEVSQAIETSKKVARVGSMVADLVTQQQSVAKADMTAIMKIGDSSLQPYNRSKPKVVITAIQMTNASNPQAKVVWSYRMENGGYGAGPGKDTIVTTVPAALRTPNAFLIRVESSLDYKPIITWSADAKRTLGLLGAFDSLAMGQTYYLRPRMSLTIPCTDC